MTPKDVKGVIAYGLAPYSTGTATFYLTVAAGLRQRGWRVFSIAVGREAAERYDPKFGDAYSIILAPEETDPAKQVQAFLKWVEEAQVDIVIPTYEDNILAAIPHLPARVRYITICHNVIRSAYLVSTVHLERLSYAVAINQLQMGILHRRWGVPLNRLRLIPNGVDTGKLSQIPRRSNLSDTIQLIYLGMISHDHKGVLWLPPMLKELSRRSILFFLHVVGSGPDSERLKAAISRNGLASRVHFYGTQPAEEIPGLLSQADISLMPSLFEGFPLALVEAMAAGCVPIATRLQGITDMIVADGVSGFLCPLGRAKAFAQKIALLSQDRPRLAQMAAAARRVVVERFSLERVAADYDGLFTEALAQPPPPYEPRPLELLEYPKELLPTWRAQVTQPAKTFVRTWANRLFGRII